MKSNFRNLFVELDGKPEFLPGEAEVTSCLCDYHKKYNARLFDNFKSWKDDFISREDKYQKKCRKQTYRIIKKLNSQRRESKYIKNSPGYLIEVKGASKWFSNSVSLQNVKVLHDINLRIKEGDFVVVLGYSGSGKSTLLNILSGIERPSNGQVIVANHNLIALSAKELTLFRKDNLSFIFQSYALLPELTVRENIMQGASLQENVYKRLDLDELVELIGIEDHLDKYVNQLSGGQQQRVAIVKSIIKNPKILFADEPTAAVDEDTAKNILKVFKDINQKYKTTIVLITHNPIISLIATKKIKVAKGRIIECINQRPVDIDNLPWVSAKKDA
ncbi:ABC transporter ATP-binding protein [Candidatus Mycoplasma haematohominis]|uniref:Bacitracin export ATP-binding protein BceA n=1 Tax=Candidatus Mycoplasma haematohominis TaxID=1494318 RepID=A0A478FPK5_9MOLU|nr:ABC transporter ATP-binding protein [Candidatus Mycoplasma haemohominis]GCE63293.1 bacitracin export ATP-binding protein BceA [Candidatus Mycoplasma haemohominis]